MNTASAPDDTVAGRAGCAGAARMLRRGVGAVIVGVGTEVVLRETTATLARFDPVATNALEAGLVAAAATALGSLPVALSRRISRRASSMMLGCSRTDARCEQRLAHHPGLVADPGRLSHVWPFGLPVSVAIACGAAFMLSLGRAFGPARFHESADRPAEAVRGAWRFVTAITRRNILEGAAIGVAFAGIDHAGAVGLATGIGVQDIPEGLAVALALRAVGRTRTFAVGSGIASGLVEPLFAALGAAVVTTSIALLPGVLAAAARAMPIVIAIDVIPESHNGGQGMPASLALVLGFMVRLALDAALA